MMNKTKLLCMMLLTLVAQSIGAQIVTGVKYQIMNSVGLALAYRDAKLVIATPDETDPLQQWVFEAQEDGNYALKNEGQQMYVGLSTSDTWNAQFYVAMPEEIGRAEYGITYIAEGYVSIDLVYNGKCLGTDDITDGSTVYLDKTISANGKWALNIMDGGSVSPLTVLRTAVENLAEQYFSDKEALYDEVTDKLYEIDDMNLPDEEAMAQLTLLQDKIVVAYRNMEEIAYLQEEIAQLLADTDYPGKEAFAALAATYDLESGSVRFDDLFTAPEALQEGMNEYNLSQVPVATADNPADLSMFIQHPSFREERRYSSSSTLTYDGWQYECVPANTDYGAYYKYAEETGKDVTGFNSWASDFKSMKLWQTLTGLPVGKYRVQCIAWTTEGSVSTQHAFATSSSGVTVTSGEPNESMASDTWESDTTAEIIVFDGNLTIGYASTGSSGSEGWFLVTDFKLYYTGMYTADEMRAMSDSVIAEARELKTPLAGDQTILDEALAYVLTVTDVDQLTEAVGALGSAVERVKTSISKYGDFIDDDYATLLKLTEEEKDERAKAVLQKVLSNVDMTLKGEYTCYEDIDRMEEILSNLETYVDYFDNKVYPMITKPEPYDAQGIEDVKVLVESNWELVETDFESSDPEALYYTLVDLAEQVMLTHVPGDDADMSFRIYNADFSTGNDWWIGSWNYEFNSVNEWKITDDDDYYQKDVSNRYMHATGADGYLVMTVSQSITDIPNGTYIMRALCRADAEGAYLYATNADGVTFKGAVTANGTYGGKLYEDALAVSLKEAAAATGKSEQEVYDDEEYDCPIADAGWDWAEVKGIEVTDHTLTIGISCDKDVTGGAEYQGYLLSADEFQLIYMEAGNNDDFGYESAITDVPSSNVPSGREGIYTLTGIRVSLQQPLRPGIYIINGRKVVKR